MKAARAPRPLKPEVWQHFRWEELKIRVDTYKYYLDLTLKANAFFYATTGVVLGVYLKEPNIQSASNLKFILLLPIFLGAVLGGIFLFAALLQKQAAASIEKILGDFKKRKLEVEKIPDLNLLYILLFLSGVIFLLVSLLLILVPFISTSGSLADNWGFMTVAGLSLFLGGGATFRFARWSDTPAKSESGETTARAKGEKDVPSPGSTNHSSQPHEQKDSSNQ